MPTQVSVELPPWVSWWRAALVPAALETRPSTRQKMHHLNGKGHGIRAQGYGVSGLAALRNHPRLCISEPPSPICDVISLKKYGKEPDTDAFHRFCIDPSRQIYDFELASAVGASHRRPLRSSPHRRVLPFLSVGMQPGDQPTTGGACLRVRHPSSAQTSGVGGQGCPQ